MRITLLIALACCLSLFAAPRMEQTHAHREAPEEPQVQAETYTCTCGVCGARLADSIPLLRDGPSDHALQQEDADASSAQIIKREIETDHYHLTAYCNEAQADELKAVMTAVWPEFTRIFGDEPKLDEDEKLRAYYFQTEAAWRKQVEQDCGWCPKAGGYYWPTNKTAYLYKQPTIYFTRMLFIHELMHQFHYLAKTNNKNPKAGWYTEGVAEYVSRHFWDGETLTLGVVPLATLEDYPAKALEIMSAEDYDYSAKIDGSQGSARPEQWATIRYLATLEGEREAREWESLRKKMDGGEEGGESFTSAIGKPKKIFPDLLTWLESEQEPWKPIWNEWEGIGPGRFRGIAPTTVSACRAKGECDELSAIAEIPSEGSWGAGLLLDYEDGQNWVIGMVYSGKTAAIKRFKEGKWSTLVSVDCPKLEDESKLALSAKRVDGKLSFHVEGIEIGSFEPASKTLGLAIQSCELRFNSVEWTASQ